MSRLEAVKAKYPSIDWEIVRTADPSKNFKYLDWIGKNFANSSVEELKSLLTKFDKSQGKLTQKDITKYDVTSLKKTLSDIGCSNAEAKKAGCIQIETKLPGVELVLLEGSQAVKAYTAGTKWCISNFGQHFLNYARHDNIFVATSNKTKMCFVVPFNSVESEILVYEPTDIQVTSQLKAFTNIGKFCSQRAVNTELIDKVKEICYKYTRTYRNVWGDFGLFSEKDFANNYERIKKNDDIGYYLDNFFRVHHFQNVRKLITFLLKAQGSYPDLVSKIKTSSYAWDDYQVDYDIRDKVRLLNLSRDYYTTQAKYVWTVLELEYKEKLQKEKEKAAREKAAMEQAAVQTVQEITAPPEGKKKLPRAKKASRPVKKIAKKVIRGKKIAKKSKRKGKRV